MKRSFASLALLAASLLASSGCEGEPDYPTPEECAGAPGEVVENDGWAHVPIGTMLDYPHNPPASGAHWTAWARYGAYTTVVPRGMWIHNLEHGAVVFLHRPDAPAATVAALRRAYDVMPADPGCGFKRAVLTPDPELDSPVAVVAADHVLEGETLSQEEIAGFVALCAGSAPESGVCADGDSP